MVKSPHNFNKITSNPLIFEPADWAFVRISRSYPDGENTAV